jgi:hypothetical protein
MKIPLLALCARTHTLSLLCTHPPSRPQNNTLPDCTHGSGPGHSLHMMTSAISGLRSAPWTPECLGLSSKTGWWYVYLLRLPRARVPWACIFIAPLPTTSPFGGYLSFNCTLGGGGGRAAPPAPPSGQLKERDPPKGDVVGRGAMKMHAQGTLARGKRSR